VIVPVTVLVLTNDTIRKQDEFSRRQTEIANYLSQYAHFNRLANVIRPSQPPLPFQTLVRGLSDDTGLSLFNNDPLPALFPMIDLTFILSILLSLAALIFSYDAISGEKEDGTLKLMLANRLSRSRIILAKIGGGLATLFIPFLVSLAVGLILILLNPRIAWKGSDWGALGLILLGGALYLGFFLGLGILISSRHASSSSSILTSLFVWVLLVLVVPNISPYIASLIRPAPSVVKVGREVDRMTDTERDDLGRKLAKEKAAAVIKANPVLENVMDMREPEIKAEIRRNPEFSRAYDLYRKEREAAWREANDIQGAKSKVLQDDLERKQNAQTKLSVGLSMISPLSAFTYFSADLSNTGTRNEEHFKTIATAWWTLYGDYMDRKLDAMRKANPTMDVWNTAVDVRDMPRFVYKEELLAARVRGVLKPFLFLIGTALAVFVASVFSFYRYDAR
ncbi:MAG: ABC transporter permease subunit, partial [Candidatus Aminicenantes bacterium]|nr:ABC transporter permease subunit [Candidatus Aminicenantes bacterium]